MPSSIYPLHLARARASENDSASAMRGITEDGTTRARARAQKTKQRRRRTGGGRGEKTRAAEERREEQRGAGRESGMLRRERSCPLSSAEREWTDGMPPLLSPLPSTSRLRASRAALLPCHDFYSPRGSGLPPRSQPCAARRARQRAVECRVSLRAAGTRASPGPPSVPEPLCGRPPVLGRCAFVRVVLWLRCAKLCDSGPSRASRPKVVRAGPASANEGISRARRALNPRRGGSKWLANVLQRRSRGTAASRSLFSLPLSISSLPALCRSSSGSGSGSGFARSNLRDGAHSFFPPLVQLGRLVRSLISAEPAGSLA